MSFLNPILLFGLAGVSVPIIIHLLNRRQIQRVPWAAMRFLQASVENNQRRLQIEDLILLLLRVLLIALIALALARPALNAAAGLFGQPASATLLLIDHSYSMSQTTGVSSRFDVAKRAAGEIVQSLPSGSSVAVWMAGDSFQPVIAEPSRDLAQARKTIETLKPADRATDLLPAIRQGLEMLKRSQSASRDLYIITDGQQTGFRQLAAIKQLLDSAKDQVRSTVVLIEQPENANLAVSSLVQSSGVAAIDRPIRFAAVVTNYGSESVRDVRVSLRLASSEAVDRATGLAAPVDDATIDVIEPGQSKAVSLFGRLKDDSYYAITASINADRVPADDSRTLVVRGTKRVRVLLVDGDLGREARDAETFFLRAAFDASGTNGQPPLIEAKVSDAGSMAGENLDDFDAVILANVSDMSANSVEALSVYVNKGGGLLIFPGDRMRRDFYNDAFGKLNLLPATFGEPKGDDKAQTRLTTFSESQLDHPIATLWKDPASGRLASISLYKYTPLTLVPPSDKKQLPPKSVLQLLDGSPAVAERTVGAGRVIVFNTTADSAWSDLPAKPGIFVPLLYRSIGAIVEKRDESLNLTVGQRFVHTTGIELLSKEAEIKYLNDPTAIPDSRRIELVNGVATLTADPTEQAGTYQLTIAGQSPLLFAAQTDASESNLETITEESRKSLAESANIMTCSADTDLASNLKQEQTGTELLFPLAVLLLMLAVTESGLAMWFSRSK